MNDGKSTATAHTVYYLVALKNNEPYIVVFCFIAQFVKSLYSKMFSLPMAILALFISKPCLYKSLASMETEQRLICFIPCTLAFMFH